LAGLPNPILLWGIGHGSCWDSCAEVRTGHWRAFSSFPGDLSRNATLIEKHEKQKKEEQGLEGKERGTEAASIDAAGSAMGSIGLLAFATGVSKWVASYPPSLGLTAATLAWMTVAIVVWKIRKAV
jgi:hypothetical protein